MSPHADLPADMMHNDLAPHFETVQNAIHSGTDIAMWISNNSVTHIDAPMKANTDLVEAMHTVSADWLRLAHQPMEYGFFCVQAFLGHRAPQELADLQEEVVRGCLLILSTYAQRLREEAARMSEEVGRKSDADLIENEQLRRVA